jgi:hypothetical protein
VIERWDVFVAVAVKRSRLNKRRPKRKKLINWFSGQLFFPLS